MAAPMRSGHARVIQGRGDAEEAGRKAGKMKTCLAGAGLPASSPRTGRVLEGFKSQWSMSVLSAGSSPEKGGQDGACPMSI